MSTLTSSLKVGIYVCISKDHFYLIWNQNALFSTSSPQKLFLLPVPDGRLYRESSDAGRSYRRKIDPRKVQPTAGGEVAWYIENTTCEVLGRLERRLHECFMTALVTAHSLICTGHELHISLNT